MTQSGAGFMTAALFARPVGASQLAKAVSLASEGVKLSRMHAIGVNRCHGGMQRCQTCRKRSFRALIALKHCDVFGPLGRSTSKKLALLII